MMINMSMKKKTFFLWLFEAGMPIVFFGGPDPTWKPSKFGILRIGALRRAFFLLSSGRGSSWDWRSRGRGVRFFIEQSFRSDSPCLVGSG